MWVTWFKKITRNPIFDCHIMKTVYHRGVWVNHLHHISSVLNKIFEAVIIIKTVQSIPGKMIGYVIVLYE